MGRRLLRTHETDIRKLSCHIVSLRCKKEYSYDDIMSKLKVKLKREEQSPQPIMEMYEETSKLKEEKLTKQI